MKARTPFFLRYTASLVLGAIAGFEQVPWVILFFLPFILVRKRFIIYSAACIAGFVLAKVKNQLPAEARIFQVKISELRTPHLGYVDVQRYLDDSVWYDHSERMLIFSDDSLPALGTIFCRAKVNQEYHGLEVENFVLIKQDTSWMDSWRMEVRQRLSSRLDPNVLSVVNGIVLGDKSGLPRNTYKMYKNAGGAHILAVSGLHVGIVYGVIQLLLYPLGNRRWLRWVKLISVVLVLWAYALITGFSPSVIRAAGFFTFFSFARFRTRNLYHTISLVLFVVLIWDPGNLYVIGLQLSYLAVLGIILFQPVFNQFLRSIENPLRWVLLSVSVSLSAQLLTFPLVAFYFGGISFAGIFTAIILIPFAFLVIVLSVLLLCTPGVMHATLNALLIFLVDIVHHALARVNSWSFSYMSWDIASFLPYYTLLTFAFIALRWPSKQTWLLFHLVLIFFLARQ